MLSDEEILTRLRTESPGNRTVELKEAFCERFLPLAEEMATRKADDYVDRHPGSPHRPRMDYDNYFSEAMWCIANLADEKTPPSGMPADKLEGWVAHSIRNKFIELFRKVVRAQNGRDKIAALSLHKRGADGDEYTDEPGVLENRTSAEAVEVLLAHVGRHFARESLEYRVVERFVAGSEAGKTQIEMAAEMGITEFNFCRRLRIVREALEPEKNAIADELFLHADYRPPLNYAERLGKSKRGHREV